VVAAPCSECENHLGAKGIGLIVEGPALAIGKGISKSKALILCGVGGVVRDDPNLV